MAGGINPFVYADNNSINFTDPLGLFTIPFPAIFGGSGIAGGAAGINNTATVSDYIHLGKTLKNSSLVGLHIFGLPALMAANSLNNNPESGLSGSTSGGSCPNGDDDDPDNKRSNLEKVNDNYLKKKGIDPHELKREFLGKKAKISRYDLYKNKNTGQIHILRKGGRGSSIETYINIR